MRLLMILILSQMISLSAIAAGDSGVGTGEVHVFAGAGPNFYFPTTVRLGWDSWEGGLLTKGFYGANKLFPLSGSSFYSSIGFGINADGDPTNLGFNAGAGAAYKIIGGLGIRMEMFALANLNGKLTAHGLLGGYYAF